MTHSDTTPRTLTADRLDAAFNEVGGQARPDYLPDIVAQAGRTRQRPAWTFLERWLPMDIAVRRQGVPRAVLVFAVLALLMTLLVATVAFIGTRPSQPPLAAATNGLLAFASGGDIVVVEPDGSGRRTLISGASELGGMAYSPDGRRLAYWSRALSGTWELIVVGADGGQPRDCRFGESRANGAGCWAGLVAGRLNDRLLCPTTRRLMVVVLPELGKRRLLHVPDLPGGRRWVRRAANRRPRPGCAESRLVAGRLHDRLRRWRCIADGRRASVPDGCRWIGRPTAQ